ncbi:phage antirepressor N-terminal domain-containing protein [Xenorhabdus griffiniae]|uniref:Phage antirepressor N-terminal domain-containing protein n=1 Tax=Xenorhabdus griffiniae TaxID=351672 RepID=A0ABY9XKT3_9GAMM|nr:phage antirepressor N-terminal domain-containing protein [Xenorhabdus griffiniae]MBD1228646.1 phage antirepressor Ant [Xenorhabdus griffiniae]MBE8588204.1 phage antirepressor Ant [Xenorhabdus griffiniae]WMV73549.1 phage antirepressor N-terminal domain-containing protein [Xenorhabdus griffiniae]WNH03229.1 phage antirepressor N-terminal domain-containing protein [Xenorhabdus griffiniae]
MSIIATKEVSETINVPFYGSDLYVVNYNGEPYVPMKPIVEGMGMNWASQFTKLKQRFKSTVVEITMVANDGKGREMSCLALRKLAGWLATISPNKVKPEIRDKVIRYQDECDDVLYEYWTTGEVKAKNSTTQDRTPLRGLVNTLMGKYGVSNKKLFQMVHHEFGVKHINELTSEQIPSAIEYLATKAIEGEFLGKETLCMPESEPQISDDNLQTLCWLWQHSINMARYMIDVEPILKVAEHKLAGEYYAYPRNAIKCANNARRILEKATEHIQIKRIQKDNWQVLHKLRIPNCPF